MPHTDIAKAANPAIVSMTKPRKATFTRQRARTRRMTLISSP